MWFARMKRMSAGRPPCRGAGARRTSSACAGAPAAAGCASPSGAAAFSTSSGSTPGNRIARRHPCDDCRPMSGQTLAERLLAGDRRALARAISLVEDDRPEGWELVRKVYPHTGAAAGVGFTGPPGVGKSTLIGALTKARREVGRTVGVLSIDPSSPFTQGALLGDRIRLTQHFLHQGVFIPSMS